MGLVEKVPWLLARLFLTFIVIERCRALPLSGYDTQQGRSVVRRQQIERPPSPSDRLQQPDLHEDRKQYTHAKSITVRCHHAWMEIVVNADLYDTGVLIDGADLRLGGEALDKCRARPSGPAEYTIFVALSDCGNKHLITDDSLIYTNLLVYSPTPSNGIVRMESVVIPIECHYRRRYGVSSSVLKPTWIPFASTVSAENILGFALRLVTSDWHSERTSNVYFLGDTIHIQASVTLDYHMPLRLFVESCVATVDPSKSSVPRYAFIENEGCLIDARATGSSSHFLPRARDETLQIQLDAFRFRRETRSALYITCHLKAIPVIYNMDSRNRACSSIRGRWRSADGNDRICDSCETGNALDQRMQSGRPGDQSMGGYYGDYGRPVKDGHYFANRPGSGAGLEKEVSLRPLEVFTSVPGNVVPLPRSRPLDNGSVEDKALRMSETHAGKELEKKTTLGPVVHPSKDYAGPVLLGTEEPFGSEVPPIKDTFNPAVPTSIDDATPAVPPGPKNTELMQTSSGFLDPGMEQEGPPMISTSGGDSPVGYPSKRYELEMEATPHSVVPPEEPETILAVLRDEKDELETETTLGPVIHPSKDYAGPVLLAIEEPFGAAVPPSKDTFSPAVSTSREDATPAVPPGPKNTELMQTSSGFLDPGMEQEGPPMISTSGGDNPVGYPGKRNGRPVFFDFNEMDDMKELEVEATSHSVVPLGEQETSPVVLRDEKDELEIETTLGPVIHLRMDYADPVVRGGEHPVGSVVPPSKDAGDPVAPSKEETNISVPPSKAEFSPAVPTSREDASEYNGSIDRGGFMDHGLPN